MPSALVLYFDEYSEQCIRDLWDSLENEGIPPDYSADIKPHITLAIYDELYCEPCGKELTEIEKQATNLSLTFSHIGFFHDQEVVLFLAPTPTETLLNFHKQVHSSLADSSKTPWDLYRPGKWVPHCTLALNIKPDKFNKAFYVCSRFKLPMTVKISKIGVVEFHPLNGIMS